MNAIKHAMPERQLNNYGLLDDDSVRKRYEQMLYAPYYLTKVSRGEPAMAGEEILPLKDEVVHGKFGLSAWVKTYEERPVVLWRVNGKDVQGSDVPGPYHWTLDTRELQNGPTTIELLVYDAEGREVGHATRTVQVQNP
jgi:hypothetical protein